MPTNRLISTFLLLCAYAQYASALELSPEERAFIAEHPTIVVGGEMDWPPMDFVEDGVYKGAAKDYLERIESLTGLSTTVVTGYSWSELLRLLRNREIDMVPMMYWTEHRGREFNLTNPYITVRHYVFTRGKYDDIDGFSDLYGRTMAIPEGYAHIDYLSANHPEIRIMEVPSILEAMDAVLTGQADAVIENTASMAYYTENHNILGLEPAFPVRYEIDNVHMAVRKDWPLLRDILQKALNEITAENATDIMARWTGSAAAAKAFLTTKAEFSASESAWLKSKGQLVACINADRMPLEAYRSNSHEGMTSEYVSVLSDTLKVPISTVALGTWHDIGANLDSGRCDIVPLALDVERETHRLSFSPTYLAQKLALATRINAEFFESLGDLDGQVLGVIEGYTDVRKLRLVHPGIRFIEYPTIKDGLEAVASDEIFGLLDYVPTINSVIRGDYAGVLKISGDFPEESRSFSFGVARGSPELDSAISKFVLSLPESLRQNIHRKWIAVSIEKRTDFRLLIQAAVAASLILLFVLLRYREVRRHREEIQAKNAELERINSQLEEQTDNAMHMAYHDQLTGLSNRAKLLIDLDHSIKVCGRVGGKVAVLFLDLDRFKYVNDSLGHNVGDKLLQAVARRISGLLRDTDTLCRVGGDEFIVVLEAFSDTYSPGIVSQRIIAALSQVFQIDEHAVNIGTSIGIAVCPDDSDKIDTLIKYADSAMYSAKEEGRNGYSFYHEDLSNKATRRVAIESALRRSLLDQDFSLVFQPIVDLKRRRVDKAEALIRWNHAELGNIPPDEFIPIAEEFGLIVDIGDWVLGKCCETLVQLQADGCPIRALAINVSSVEFLKGDVATRFKSIIDRYDVNAKQIDIEITERYMLERGQGSEMELEELRRLGHTICVDDFGTGYSSLSYMKRLPLNIIKIDRSFIQSIPHDQNDVEISQAIISLSHSLGYEVVAEGVESADQLDFLLERACDFAQGYYFSKPVKFEDLQARVDEIERRLRVTGSTVPRIHVVPG